jgi:hypothetical protein
MTKTKLILLWISLLVVFIGGAIIGQHASILGEVIMWGAISGFAVFNLYLYYPSHEILVRDVFKVREGLVPIATICAIILHGIFIFVVSFIIMLGLTAVAGALKGLFRRF